MANTGHQCKIPSPADRSCGGNMASSPRRRFQRSMPRRDNGCRLIRWRNRLPVEIAARNGLREFPNDLPSLRIRSAPHGSLRISYPLRP